MSPLAKRGGQRTFRLVYWESTNDILAAIHREKHIKRWKRVRRLELIGPLASRGVTIMPEVQ